MPPQKFTSPRTAGESPDSSAKCDPAEIEPGTLAKIRFEFAPRHLGGAVYEAELMWVKILWRESDNTYVGELRNEPHAASNLRWGQHVRFASADVVRVANS